eukprot:ANDGO_05832.mRNA.1 Regulatory-associated protein of TOR 2
MTDSIEEILQSQSNHEFFRNASASLPSLAPNPVQYSVRQWRLKEKLKTLQGILVVCLNIGVDPPDVVKVHPCAKLQCWVDPSTAANGPANNGTKALEIIGNNLKAQYERWQPRARHSLCLDPTIEDIKKTVLSVRKNSKGDRILFHYNGHGVPRPTQSGELWFFNKNFTQYLPLSIWDVFTWIGEPNVFVFDCSAAANIGIALANLRMQKTVPLRDTLILAACGPGELLPMNPRLPADIFSSCLTTPIKVALKLYTYNNHLLKNIDDDILDKIPGKIIDRKTPIGELNWIFTAITDTIAWNVLPRKMFQRLFRQDLLVASLFRNFLFADRVMRQFSCTPVSFPRMPPTHNHSLWQSWDLALDICLSQMPLLNPAAYTNSSFFADQLTAFEVWLDNAEKGCMFRTSEAPAREFEPEQLPIVLQVLLSQTHRFRALKLLARFLDLGPWAVNLSLAVGIFPYVLKLLQSQAAELRGVLVSIWARILALDESCQADLTKDGGWNYFITCLSVKTLSAELKAKACFVLCRLLSNRMSKTLCLSSQFVPSLIAILSDPEAASCNLLKKWVCLCIARFIDDFEEGRHHAWRECIDDCLVSLFRDDNPSVRAAAVYCAGVLIRGSTSAAGSDDTNRLGELEATNIRLGWLILPTLEDGSAIVRLESACACGYLTANAADHIRSIVGQAVKEDKNRTGHFMPKSTSSRTVDDEGSETSASSVSEDFYRLLWLKLQFLSIDPAPWVSETASKIIQFVVRGLIAQQQQEMGRRPIENAVAPHLSPSVASSYATSSPTSTPMSKKKKASFSMLSRSSKAELPEEPIPVLENEPEFLSSALSQSDLPSSNYYDRSIGDFAWNNRSLNDLNVQNVDGSALHKAAITRKLKSAFDLSHTDFVDEKKKLDDPVAVLDNMSESVTCLRFHAFDPVLVMSDEGHKISVWMWEKAARIRTFSNGNLGASRITALEFINESQYGASVLAAGSDDGHVRVWKGATSVSDSVELLAGFAAISEMPSKPQGPGLLMTWQQQFGRLTVGGPLPFLRIWDLERLKCLMQLQTDNSLVTCMNEDQALGNTLIAGCEDGSVRVFDTRLPSDRSNVAIWKEHAGSVVNVHRQMTTPSTVISASIAGDIKFWDLRRSEAVRTVEAHRTGMTSFAVHNYAPVMASGSNNSFIKVYDIYGGVLNMIYYHDGFLDQWMGPLSCLMFHPTELFLAAAAVDSSVSIYGRR